MLPEDLRTLQPRAWVEGRVMDAYMARLVLAARGRGRRVGGASVHLVARAGNLLAWPREQLRQLVAQPCPPGSWKPDIVLQASCIDEAETLLVPHHSRGDHWALVEGECPPHLFFYLQTLDPHPPNPRPPPHCQSTRRGGASGTTTRCRDSARSSSRKPQRPWLASWMRLAWLASAM